MNNCGCNGNIKAYFKLDYRPNKLSQLENDMDYLNINDVNDLISEHNLSEEAHPYIQELVSTAELNINTKIGDLTDLDTSVKTSIVNAINSEVSARSNADTGLSNDYNAKIGTLSNLESSVKTDVVSAINSVISDTDTTIGDLDDLDTSVKTSIVTAINSEVSDRQNADSGLQTQIDALAASSDVTDIVGTYAELQAYDTQHLNDNDIIKVLDDSTHNDAPSYYRYNKSTNSFTYIGSESASYTKAESDTLFVPQTRTVNSKALSADITLTSSDVGALASTTTINDLTTTAQQNALNSGATTTNIGQIATNTSSISTINGKIPSDASSSNKLVTASALSNAVVNLADKDLANLTQTGEERLHALKAYSDNGELLTDAEGLADITTYAHSSYCGDQASNASPLDDKKFVYPNGYKPTITTNGLISDITTGNYVYENITIPFSTANTWDIEWEINYTANSAIQRPIQGRTGNGILIFNINDNQWSSIFMSSDGSSFDLASNKNTNFKFEDGQKYKLKWSYTGTEYRLYIDGNEITDAKVTSTTKLADTKLNIFCGTSFAPMAGVQNLKSVQIRINNIPVFSGNKTGIDTIKSDDYSVVGTPTISADGVASGFSTSNYITKSSVVTIGASGEFHIDFEYSGTAIADLQYLLDLYNTTSNEIVIRRASNSNSYTCVVFVGGTAIFNQSIDIVGDVKGFIEYKNGVYTFDLNGSQKTLTSSTQMNALSYNLSLGARLASGTATQPLTAGSIDLNALKIHVDGNLVYQPCLKIPYTLSKTGSKVVNYIYRDRVNDMAEQFGNAPYYTLSDTDFTLPQGEVYGLFQYRHKWIYADQTTAISTATAIGTYDLTSAITSVLPVDSDSYECLFRYGLSRKQVGGSTNSHYIVTVNNNIVLYESLDSAATSGNVDTNNACGQFMAIIDKTRAISLEISEQALNTNDLYLVAYRKIN